MEYVPEVKGKIDKLPKEVMDKLREISKITRKPVTVTSGVREKLPGTKGESAHYYHLAADIEIPGLKTEGIAELMRKVGFTGVGCYYNSDGTETTFAHGDIRGDLVADGTYYGRGKDHGVPAHWVRGYLLPKSQDPERKSGKDFKNKAEWLKWWRKWVRKRKIKPSPPKAKLAPPAEMAKPAPPPAAKARPTFKMNRTMLIAIILALAIMAVLLAVFLSSFSGTPAGDLVGTWRTSSPVTFHTQTDADYPFTLHDVGSEKRDITWTITAGTSDGTFDIEQDYTSSDKSYTGMYTPEFSPNFYVGVISGDRLTVKSGDVTVGDFNFTSSIITGTWDDSTWSAIYTQRTYTASNGLTLTKQ
jgi:hypothetical protein